MNRGGLCETCISPGACCDDLYLMGDDGQRKVDTPMSFERAEHVAMSHGLPFRPLRQMPNGEWRWWCSALDRSTGRCTVYENRPQLCRDYVAGSDPLCVHHHRGE